MAEPLFPKGACRDTEIQPGAPQGALMLSCSVSPVGLLATLRNVARGSSVHGSLQARMLEWIAMPSSGTPPDPGTEPQPLKSSALAGRFFTASAIWVTCVSVHVLFKMWKGKETHRRG